MQEDVDLTTARERARRLAEGMSALAEREDVLARVLAASAEGDAEGLRAAFRELPGDPFTPELCPHFMIVSLPIKVYILERVCRWSCGIHEGEVVASDGSVELEGGRSTTLSQEAIAILEGMGVISCSLGGHIERQFIDVWRQACEPDYAAG